MTTTAINQLYLKLDETTERSIYSATEIDLGYAAARDKNNTISADTIRISGEISISAKAVKLYCRHLICSGGALINTSGHNARNSFSPGMPPQQPDSPGRNGLDGKAADDGGDAGNVTILAEKITGNLRIRAVGGNGGRGQDGEDGCEGEPGTPGSSDVPAVEVEAYDSSSIPEYAIHACDAPPGGKGGNGGRAGMSGKGGNGGRVRVNTKVPLTLGQVSIAANAGSPGPLAKPGNIGLGGRSTTPGRQEVKICENIPSGRYGNDKRVCEFSHWVYGRQLRRGTDGDYFPAIPPGPSISPAPNTDSLSGAELAAGFNNLLLDMLCWKVEDDYRQSGGIVDSEFITRLNFLIEVCNADLAPNAGKKTVLAKVYALKRKAEMNLDYYGYSLEDAPLLSYETYANLIGRDLISQLGRVEDHYHLALDKSQSAEKRRQEITQAINEAELIGTQLATTIETNIESAQYLNKKIKGLEEAVSQARYVLELAHHELERAVKDGSGQGCDLGRILTAAMVIYASYQTGAAAFGGMSGAFDTIVTNLIFDDSLKKLFQNREGYHAQYKSIQGGYNSIQDSMSKIGAELDALGPQPPQPLPSLAMEKGHFDQVAAQFAQFAAAAGYKNAGYAFLRSVEARNQSVVDYNAALLRLLELQARLFANKDAVNALRTQLSAGYNPELALIFNLLTRIYRDTMTFVGSCVHAERKALAYATNEPVMAPISELSTATLVDTHAKTTTAWLAAKNRFKKRKTREFVLDLFDFIDKPKSDSIADSLSSANAGASKDESEPDSLARFKNTGELVFFIRRDHEKYAYKFKNMPGLRLMNIELLLQGVVVRPDAPFTGGEIYWKLKQGGREEVYRPDGSMVNFRHMPVSVGGSLMVDGSPGTTDPGFTEDELYFGLSPFASWHLSIIDFSYFNFSNLKGAQLKVKGSYVEETNVEATN